jgi:hypothetical protein
MNTFDDDNDLGIFEEPPRRPPRDRSQRRPPRSSRRQGTSGGSNTGLRLAGLVALGIAIVVGFVLWVGSCGSSTSGYSSYFAAMQPLAQESASVGKEFATALATPGLTMDEFQSDLARWSQLEQKDYVEAQRLQPPALLQGAHAEALAAFQLRYNSLDRIAKHLSAAQAEHAGASVAAAALASDAQLLSASDIVWAELFKLAATQTLTGQKVTGVRVPASKIVTSPDIVSASQLATVYQRLGSPSKNHKVTGIHGSNLIGTNAVENGVTKALSETTGTTVAWGPDLVIDVVFENSGDFPEVNIGVTLSVSAGGKSLYTKSEKVPQLAARQQVTVSFKDLQIPTSALSHNASISVRIKRVPGEARLDNNAATYPVLLRLAPS